jgi:hypothetical protein
VEAHGEVGEEVAAGVVAVGADATDLGGEVEDDGGAEGLVEALDVGLAGEVVVLLADGDDVGAAAGGEFVEDEGAEEAAPAGDDDAVGFEDGVGGGGGQSARCGVGVTGCRGDGVSTSFLRRGRR